MLFGWSWILLFNYVTSLSLSSGTCTLIDDKVVYFGGEVYDKDTNSFKVNKYNYELDLSKQFELDIANSTAPWKLIDNKEMELGISMNSLFDKDQQVFLIGGKIRNSSNLFQRYNLSNNQLTSINITNNTYFNSIIQSQPNKTISYELSNFIKKDEQEYILNGGVFTNFEKNNIYMKKLFSYFPSNNTWKDYNIDYGAIIGHYSTIYNDMMITIGGLNDKNKYYTLSKLLIHDFKTNQFKLIDTGGDIPESDSYSRSIHINNFIYTFTSRNFANSELYKLDLDNFKWIKSNNKLDFIVTSDSCLINKGDYLIHSFGKTNQTQYSNTQLIDITSDNQVLEYQPNKNNEITEETNPNDISINLNGSENPDSSQPKSFGMVLGVVLSCIIVLLAILGALIFLRLRNLKKQTILQSQIKRSEDKLPLKTQLSNPSTPNSIKTHSKKTSEPLYSSFTTGLHSTGTTPNIPSTQYNKGTNMYLSTANSANYQ